ncbi:hypothetical protein BC830DRAFT_1137880 [Chytriomyces sp. MP71]|nr:hypothetical protein BC830DRAFT_1137880 [Chytriomyces sp. MP71]
MQNVPSNGTLWNHEAAWNTSTDLALTPLGHILSNTVILPTHVVGVILNGSVLATFIFSKAKLLADRLDQIVFSLLLTCLVWAITSARRYMNGIIDPFPSNSAMNRFSAVEITFCLICIFGLNLMLAMERYLTFSSADMKRHQKYFVVVYIMMGLQAVVTVWVFANSTSANGFSPDLAMPRLVWISSIFVSFAVTVAAISFLYWRTFNLAAQGLVGPMQDTPSKIQATIKRKILTYCFLMAASVLVLYTPAVAWELTKKMVLPHVNATLAVILDRATVEMSASDVIVTPSLVLFFNAEARREMLIMFGVRKREQGQEQNLI